MKLNIEKIAKHVFPVLCVMFLLVSVLVVPAHAVDTSVNDSTDGWFSVMDYNDPGLFAFILNGSNNFIKDIELDLPSKIRIYRMEIIVQCSNGAPDISFLKGQEYIPFEVIPISSVFYRYVVDVTGLYRDDLHIRISGDTYYSGAINAFNVSSIYTDRFDDTAGFDFFTFVPGSNESNKMDMIESVYQSKVNQHVSVEPYLNGEFNSFFYTRNWKKYDYLNFKISGWGFDINSISADINGLSLPVEYTYLDDFTYVDPQYNTTSSSVCIMLRVDLTGVDRTTSNKPTVTINGIITYPWKVSPKIILESCVGEIVVTEPSENVYWYTKLFNNISTWFSNLKTWLSSGFDKVVNKLDVLVNGSEEQQQAAEEYKEQSAEQAGQINSAVDNMQVSKPEAGSINGSVDAMTGGMDFGLYNNALVSLANTPTVRQIMLIAVTLMTVSYLFFGKKV